MKKSKSFKIWVTSLCVGIVALITLGVLLSIYLPKQNKHSENVHVIVNKEPNIKEQDKELNKELDGFKADNYGQIISSKHKPDKQLQQQYDEIFAQEQEVAEKIYIHDKLEELASKIGIDVIVLETLTPSEHDGKVYASNIENFETKEKIYNAFKTGRNYGYIISEEYKLFENAIIQFHTGTDETTIIDSIQKAIDIFN